MTTTTIIWPVSLPWWVTVEVTFVVATVVALTMFLMQYNRYSAHVYDLNLQIEELEDDLTKAKRRRSRKLKTVPERLTRPVEQVFVGKKQKVTKVVKKPKPVKVVAEAATTEPTKPKPIPKTVRAKKPKAEAKASASKEPAQLQRANAQRRKKEDDQ